MDALTRTEIVKEVAYLKKCIEETRALMERRPTDFTLGVDVIMLEGIHSHEIKIREYERLLHFME